MRRKILAVAALTLSMSMLSGTAAFAAEWGRVGTQWFYYEDDNTVAKNTWRPDAAGDLYWLGADGVMVTNTWVNADDAWYYVDANGKMMKGQQLVQNRDVYWLGADGKMLANTWYQDTTDGKWYYLESDGRAARGGWRTIDGDEYYFLNSGAMATSATVPGGGHVGADGKKDK